MWRPMSVGAMEPVHHGSHGASRNRVCDWVNAHRLTSVIVVGICSDICVMDFVLTMLSARNHGCMPTLRDVVVLEPDGRPGVAVAADAGATVPGLRTLATLLLVIAGFLVVLGATAVTAAVATAHRPTRTLPA